MQLLKKSLFCPNATPENGTMIFIGVRQAWKFWNGLENMTGNMIFLCIRTGKRFFQYIRTESVVAFLHLLRNLRNLDLDFCGRLSGLTSAFDSACGLHTRVFTCRGGSPLLLPQDLPILHFPTHLSVFEHFTRLKTLKHVKNKQKQRKERFWHPPRTLPSPCFFFLIFFITRFNGILAKWAAVIL